MAILFALAVPSVEPFLFSSLGECSYIASFIVIPALCLDITYQVCREALPQLTSARDPLVNDVSAIYELMKLAWAMHEITPDFINEVTIPIPLLPPVR